MTCCVCGKEVGKKYFVRLYCRDCIAKLKEGYWKLKKEEERLSGATDKEGA